MAAAREELMLPMQDGVRLYTEIFKPEGLAQFPVLIQLQLLTQSAAAV